MFAVGLFSNELSAYSVFLILQEILNMVERKGIGSVKVGSS